LTPASTVASTSTFNLMIRLQFEHKQASLFYLIMPLAQFLSKLSPTMARDSLLAIRAAAARYGAIHGESAATSAQQRSLSTSLNESMRQIAHQQAPNIARRESLPTRERMVVFNDIKILFGEKGWGGGVI
jgi:hypothetical protein